jgi:hypothetical protein
MRGGGTSKGDTSQIYCPPGPSVDGRVHDDAATM